MQHEQTNLVASALLAMMELALTANANMDKIEQIVTLIREIAQ